MTLDQRGDGRDQLRQTGAKSDEGQGNDRLRHAQLFGDDGAVVHQQVRAHGNDRRANHQEQQLLPQRDGRAVLVGFLVLGSGGFDALTDGDDHVEDKHRQQHDAQRPGELPHPVGGEAVDGGCDEEENHRLLHGLHIHGGRTDGQGNGGNERRIADNGADGVAVGHGALTVQCAGGGHHHLRQCGADGHHGGAHDDLGNMEAPGKAGGAVHEPVAALDEQHEADCEQ